MSLWPSSTMTPTPTQPHDSEPDVGSDEQDRLDLKVWLDCVSDLAGFTTTEQILGQLRAAARSRRPDPVLTSLCELVKVDRRSTLARFLLAEAFADELDRVVEGIELFHEEDADARFVAEQCLFSVIEESVLLGERQVGKVIVSRTWARAFHAAQRWTDSVLLAEAGALVARALLSIGDHLALLRSRPLLDRICGRLSPVSEAERIRTDTEACGGDIGDLAAERGLSPLVVRHQVRELEALPAGRARRLGHLEATLSLGHDIARRSEGSGAGVLGHEAEGGDTAEGQP
jgi:hypothetical protein